MRQPCLDCGTPSPASRCLACATGHRQQRDQVATARRKSMGGRPHYGASHRKQGEGVRATAVHCWLCGQGQRPNDPWQADHIIPAFQGGGGGLAPAHRSCNIARSNQIRAGKPDPAIRAMQRNMREGGRDGRPADQPSAHPPHHTPSTNTELDDTTSA